MSDDFNSVRVRADTTTGDLIPLADHKLAVALAYQRAADKCETERKIWDRGYNTTSTGFCVCKAMAEARDAILALADSDPLAEVQALKAELEAADRMLLAEANASLERLASADAAEAEVRALKAELVTARRRGDTLAEGWRIADDGRIAAEAEVARLREALNHIDALDPEESVGGISADAARSLVNRVGSIARAALQPKAAP